MKTQFKSLCILACLLPTLSMAQEKTLASQERVQLSANDIVVLNKKLDTLDDMIKKQNYKDARSFLNSENIEPSATTERLKVWAEKGDTAATWILAEQYYKAQRYQESANWTYTAFLGTRIDANLCINKTAGGLERNVVSSFFDTVQAARRDATTMRDGIVFAIDTQTKIKPDGRRPLWLCSLVAHDPTNNGLINTSSWSTEVERQIKIFTDKTTRK